MNDDTTIVELYVPNDLLERLDIFATIVGKDRSEVLVDALRSYLQTVTSDDEYLDQIVDAYNDDEIADEELRLLLDNDDLECLQALNQHLDEDQ